MPILLRRTDRKLIREGTATPFDPEGLQVRTRHELQARRSPQRKASDTSPNITRLLKIIIVVKFNDAIGLLDQLRVVGA